MLGHCLPLNLAQSDSRILRERIAAAVEYCMHPSRVKTHTRLLGCQGLDNHALKTLAVILPWFLVCSPFIQLVNATIDIGLMQERERERERERGRHMDKQTKRHTNTIGSCSKMCGVREGVSLHVRLLLSACILQIERAKEGQIPKKIDRILGGH